MKVVVEGEGGWEFPDDATDGEIAVTINAEKGLGPRGVPEFAGREAGVEPSTSGPGLFGFLRKSTPAPQAAAARAGPPSPPGGTAPRPGSLAPQVMRPPNPLLAPSHAPFAPPQAAAMAPAHVPFVPPQGPTEGPAGQFMGAAGAKFAQVLPGMITGGARAVPETIAAARNVLVDGLLELATPAMEAVTAKQQENVEKQKEAFREGLKWATLLSPLGGIAQPAAKGVKALEERWVKPWEEHVAGSPRVQRIDQKFGKGSEGGLPLRKLLTDPEAVGGAIGTAGASLIPMAVAPGSTAGYVLGALMEAGGALRDIERYETETGKPLAPAKKAATVALTGAISGALERFGFEVATGHLAKALPKRFRQGFVRAASQTVQGAVGEIGTEEAQTVTANLLQKLLVDPTQEWNEGWKEAFIGAAGAGGGVGSATGAGRSMDVAERAKRMKAREQWRGEEAPWSLDAEDGGQPLPDDLTARRTAWQEQRRAAPATPAPPGADEGLSRVKAEGQGLDAQLRSLQSEAGMDTTTPPARPRYQATPDDELRQLEGEAATLNERIEALRRGEVPPALRRPPAEQTQPPHGPISVDQLLGAQALGGVVRETTFRDQTAEGRGRNVQTVRAREERQRIANTPGEALRLILGDEPAFRPEPSTATPPETPGERRRTPVPILDWIDERSSEIDEDRRTAAPEEWTHEEARYFALTDVGTGLANRRAYEIGQKQSPNAVHAVLDVDNLKKINDTYGHETGNEYLSTVALVARAHGVRLFRVGGDEFTALYNGREEEIQGLLEGVRNSVESTRMPVEGREEGEYPLHEGFSYGTGPNPKTADVRAYEDKRRRKAGRAAGADPQVLPEPVGVGRGPGPEAPSGTRGSARVPVPVRGRRDDGNDGGASGAPPAGSAPLPPPVAPPAPAAARPSAPEAAPAPPPNPPPSTSSFSRTGKDAEAVTADGERVGVKWAVADVFDDVVPSHSITLEENPAFAQVLQPRNRERMASEQQVERMARAIRPAELGENYHASSGAPIVGPDRLVESGNGRTIALQRAYRMGRGEEYRTWLEEHAAEFGLTPEQVREVKSPVLVRVRTTPTENRGELVKKFNVATVAGMSDAETARSDADRLTPELLAKFEPSDEGGSITAARNRPFVADFLAKVPETEREKMLDEDGLLSKGGISRIQNALLGKAYGRSAILERLTESTDDNIKQVSTALVNAAPAMATLRGAIEGGEVLAELDPTPALVEAAEKLSWLRDQKQTVERYLRQQGLFGEDMTPAGRETLRAFEEFKRSGLKSTDFLTKLARSITLGGSAKQNALFDDVAIPGLEAFVEGAREFVSDGGTGQLALEAGSSDRVPPETGRRGPEGVSPGEPSDPVDRPRVSLSREGAPAAADARRVMLVERFARNLSAAWKDAPRITVVPTEEGLPDELRALLSEDSRVKGVYVPLEDQVYLVAGSLRNREDVERAVLHEVMGHAGLRRVLGREQYGTVMDGIARSMPDEVRAKAEEYELDVTTPEGRQEAADEVLAEWASRGEAAPRPLARAVMTIRGWLRKLFPNLTWTADEVRTLLAKARTRVERGTGGSRADSAPRASRGGALSSFLSVKEEWLRANQKERALHRQAREEGEEPAGIAEARQEVDVLVDKMETLRDAAKVEREAEIEAAVGSARAARFHSPRRPGAFLVLSRDTETPGAWRVTRFDERGPEGHTSFANKKEAVKHVAGTERLASYALDEWTVDDIRFSRKPSGERTVSVNGVELRLNNDGTVYLYHHTTEKNAAEIRTTARLRSAGDPDVYVTTEKDPKIGFGESVVRVRVDPRDLVLDDVFPDGRADFRMRTELPGRAKAVRFSRTGATGPAQGQRRENVRRIYQALVDDVRRQSEAATQRFTGLMDELNDPADVLERRKQGAIPEHSRALDEMIARRTPEAAKFLNPAEQAYQETVRRHYALEKATRVFDPQGNLPAHKDPGIMAERIGGAAGIAEEWMFKGGPFRRTADGGIERTGTPALEAILGPVQGKLREMDRYLLAARVVELQGRKPTQPGLFGGTKGIVTGVDPDDARAEVAAASPEVKEAARLFYQWENDALEYWADAGGLSPETKQVIREMNRSYVPLYRIFEGKEAQEVAKRMGPGRAGAWQAEQSVKRITGGKDPVLSPLVAAIDHVKRMVRAGDVNLVARTLVEAAEARALEVAEAAERRTDEVDPRRIADLRDAASRAAVGHLIARVPTTPASQNVTPEGRRVAEAARGYGVEITQEAAEAISALSAKRLTTAEDSIRIWRNGKLEEYRLEKSLGKSLRALSPEDVGAAMRALQLPTDLFRGGVTKAPRFMAWNIIRDTGDASIQTTNGFIPILDTTRGFVEAVRDGKLRHEFLAGGGGYATISEGRIKGAEQILERAAAKGAAKSTLFWMRHPLEGLNMLARPFEEASRLGEFRKARLKGKSTQEASIDAARITTNFTVRGANPYVYAFIRLVPFLNPAIQGVDRMARAVFQPPRGPARGSPEHLRQAAVVGWHGVVNLMLPTMLLYLLNRDDDEIQELRKSKAGAVFWYFRAGPKDGPSVIIPVPKPFAWGQLFGSGTEALLDKFLEQDRAGFDRWSRDFLESLGVKTERPWYESVLGTSPPTVQMAAGLMKNRDLFFNTPIVPRGLEDVEPRYQAGRFTGATMRRVGDTMNWSPAKLEYAARQTFGTLGREALRATDKLLAKDAEGVTAPAGKPSDLPLVGGAFARTPSTRTYSIEQLYLAREQAEEKVKTLRELRKTHPERVAAYREKHAHELRTARLLGAATDRLGDIRKRMERIRNTPDREMSPAEKTRELDELTRRMTELSRSVLERTKKRESR